MKFSIALVTLALASSALGAATKREFEQRSNQGQQQQQAAQNKGNPQTSLSMCI